MNESSLLNQILLDATKFGHRLFRNNTGLGWVGKSFRPSKQTLVSVGPQDVVIKNARPLHAGLYIGGSDLIGWTSVVITQEMVGRRVAIFTAVEGKTGNLKATDEQDTFIKNTSDSGGLAVVARSPEDYSNMIKDAWGPNE